MYIIYGVVSILVYAITIDFIESFSKGSSNNIMEYPYNLSQHETIVKLGRNLIHDFKKFPHIIIAGHTGYGKTNLIKVILEQLKGDIYLIDLKGGEDYERISAGEVSEAREILEEIVINLKEKRKRHIYVIVDEAGELLIPSYMTKKQGIDYLKCQEYLSEIARLGRSQKVHLIYCTQYPTADILNRQIKSNAETRIIFRLPTVIQSRVALDENGAEELPAGMKGLCIYKNDTMRIEQTYYINKKGCGDYVKVKDKEFEGTGNNFIIE